MFSLLYSIFFFFETYMYISTEIMFIFPGCSQKTLLICYNFVFSKVSSPISYPWFSISISLKHLFFCFKFIFIIQINLNFQSETGSFDFRFSLLLASVPFSKCWWVLETWIFYPLSVSYLTVLPRSLGYWPWMGNSILIQQSKALVLHFQPRQCLGSLAKLSQSSSV